MSIVVNGYEHSTLSQPIYVDGRQVLEAYANGVHVYPDASDANNEPYVVKVAGEVEYTFRHTDYEPLVPVTKDYTMRAACVASFVSSRPLAFEEREKSFRLNANYISTDDSAVSRYSVGATCRSSPGGDIGEHAVGGSRSDISQCRDTWHVEACVWFDSDDDVGTRYYHNGWWITATEDFERFYSQCKRTPIVFPYHGSSGYWYGDSFADQVLYGGSEWSLHKDGAQRFDLICAGSVYRDYSYHRPNDGVMIDVLGESHMFLGPLFGPPRPNRTARTEGRGFTVAFVPFTRLLYTNNKSVDGRPVEEAPGWARHAFPSDLRI